MNVIETESLTKNYSKFLSFKKVKAVDNLTFSVPKGCVFGFLGLNGAGKTSTIKMLLGLSYPDGGSGSILGEPIGDVDTKAKIGFLPEEAYFQRHLTAYDFLDFCAKTLHIEGDERKSRVMEMLKLVKLEEKKNSKLNTFSKGMLQRVGVAQALINDPDLVIFDEPLTGLDPVGRAELKEIMKSIKNRGKTVFFSSHILSDVQEICDYIGIMNKGQLIFSGPISSLAEEKGYLIEAANVPVNMLEKLEKYCSNYAKEGDVWKLEVSTLEDKDKIIKIFEEENMKNYKSTVNYSELEPAFLEKVDLNNKERGLA